MYPSEENECFSLLLIVFLVKIHFFLLFFTFQNNKKSVPSEETFDCFFSQRYTFFLYYFSNFKIEKVHPSEENVCFSLLLTVFLVKVRFFYYCSHFKTLKFKRPRCPPQQFGVTQGVFFYTKWHHHKMIGPRVCDFLPKHWNSIVRGAFPNNLS